MSVFSLVCPKQGVPIAEERPELFRKTWWLFFYNMAVRVLALPMIQDTHANRANYAADYYSKFFYYETDRNVFYVSQQVSGVWTWVYSSGEMRGTLSPDQKPADLGTVDAGFIFVATDYLHKHRWTGSAWEFAPGDPGSKFIVEGIATPLGGLWQLCDGSAVNVDQANGTLTSVTTPDTTGDIFIQGGTYTGTRKAAARATWEAGAKTGIESTKHTHDVYILGESIQPGGDPAQTVGQDDVTLTTTEDSVDHDHALTDALSQLKVPSEANGGVPLRINIPRYMRR